METVVPLPDLKDTCLEHVPDSLLWCLGVFMVDEDIVFRAAIARNVAVLFVHGIPKLCQMTASRRNVRLTNPQASRATSCSSQGSAQVGFPLMALSVRSESTLPVSETQRPNTSR